MMQDTPEIPKAETTRRHDCPEETRHGCIPSLPTPKNRPERGRPPMEADQSNRMKPRHTDIPYPQREASALRALGMTNNEGPANAGFNVDSGALKMQPPKDMQERK